MKAKRTQDYFNQRIRKKIIISFVTLIIVVSFFFILEGFYGARTLARQLELNNAHHLLTAFENGFKETISENGNEYFGTNDGKEFGNIELKKILNPDEFIVHQTHDKESTEHFYEVDGNTYLGLTHLEGGREVHYIKKLSAYDNLLYEFIKRSLITTSVVFWISIWVSIYVAVLLAKFINAINKNRVLSAYTEQRTGLKNSTYLEQKINLDNKDVVVIHLTDLSGFEDVFGAQSRDIVLVKFSDQLRKLENLGFTIGHYEYSRFYLVCEPIDTDEIYTVLDNIINELSDTIDIDGIEYQPKLVLGASNGDTTNKLDKAISAVRYAKSSFINKAVYYESMDSEAKQRLSYSSELSRAVKKNEFVMLYQPKINLKTGTIIGVEALVRWMHPQDGCLSPDKFIDLVPKSHISKTFTINLIYIVVKQIEEWKKTEVNMPVSVNVFPEDLANSAFLGELKKLVKSKSWLIDFIELELLESETSLNINTISDGLIELKKIGIVCSIDDFGTGMSSLAYLKSIPVSIVKIDKTFIQDINSSYKSEAIVKGVISIANSMGWTVIAEGIETQDVSEKLVKIGIEMGQGYYYSKPVPAKEILILVNSVLDNDFFKILGDDD